MASQPTILIVDDDDFALDILGNTMTRMGYDPVTATNGREALEILRRGDIHLVITDWDMPEMTGIELCRAVRSEDLSGYVYIIMLTGREGPKQRLEGLCAGADDFINKPVDPEELLVCLKTSERILSLETRDLALFALAKLAESRDSETGAHVERVQSYSRHIAQNLSKEVRTLHGIDEEYVRLLHQTSALHDLGKVSIPDAILLKPGRLTPDEFEIMKTHTLVGAETLDAALQRFPNARFLQIARNIALSHHERFDGSGYPHGLAGQQIPICGRIVAVADVYDALTSRRVYKEAMTHEQARAIILRDRGGHFDPEVVDAFLRAEPQILAARDRLRDDVALPAPIAIPSAPPARKAHETPLCKILIVEDDPLLLGKLTELLQATGQAIFSATNGAEAMEVIERERPRVIVSDWVMPKMDGVELCKQIRANAELGTIHFIMLTAHSDKGRLLDAYGAGIDDFIAKPFNPEELLARVRAGLRSARLHDDMERKANGSVALNAQLATLNTRLERLSITDELTGLFNRRHAISRLEEEWAMVNRYGRPLTVAMVDIDHFKRINDMHGHLVGDMVLQEIARHLREQTRGTDVVCRVGGEEFLILFPAQTSQEAVICVERLRSVVEKHAFNCDGAIIKVTLSIGLATRTPNMAEFTDLLKRADESLYAAKSSGRNAIRAAELPGDALPAAPAQAASPASPASPVAPASASSAMSFDVVMKHCGGDVKFSLAVIDRFRKQALGEVDKIEGSFSRNDVQAAQRVAHSLKSMAKYVSAYAAAEVASQIENTGPTADPKQVSALTAELRREITSAMNWLTHNEHQLMSKSA